MAAGGKGGGRGGRTGRGSKGSGGGRRTPFGFRRGERGLAPGANFGAKGMEDLRGEAPDVNCICPNCGHQERHVPGRPCRQRKCPKCRSKMKPDEKEPAAE